MLTAKELQPLSCRLQCVASSYRREAIFRGLPSLPQHCAEITEWGETKRYQRNMKHPWISAFTKCKTHCKLGDKAIQYLLQIYRVCCNISQYRAREMNLGLVPQLAAANAGGLVAKLAKLENQPSVPLQKTNKQSIFNMYQYHSMTQHWISAHVTVCAVQCSALNSLDHLGST